MSGQTSSAKKPTLRCQGALIKDLRTDGFDFVLTARLQSDILEQWYSHGQYKQMSGGRFLFSAKNVMYSENVLKLKSLMQEVINIDDPVKVEEDVTEDITEFLTKLEDHLGDIDAFGLFQESREIPDHIAGHTAYNKFLNILLSRGGVP